MIKLNKGLIATLFMSSFYILAGLNHFWQPAIYLKMVPPFLPQPALLVGLSGIAESLLGLLLWFKSTRVLAGWGLIGLLLAIFPANIYLATHPQIFPDIPGWVLWARLPLQGVFIYWAYCFTRSDAKIISLYY